MSDSQGYDPYVHDPHGAVGAYVADALDDDERTVFEQHLEGGQSCRREVAEFTETAAELTWLSEATPPPSLGRRCCGGSRPYGAAAEQPVKTSGSPVSPGSWASAQTSTPGSPSADRRGGTSALDPRRPSTAGRWTRWRRGAKAYPPDPDRTVAAAFVLVVDSVAGVRAPRQPANQQVASQQVNEVLTAPTPRSTPPP